MNNSNSINVPETRNKVIKPKEEHQPSFSFDHNDMFVNTLKDQNLSLNKANYLTYDRKVQAFNNIQNQAEVIKVPKKQYPIKKNNKHHSVDLGKA